MHLTYHQAKASRPDALKSHWLARTKLFTKGFSLPSRFHALSSFFTGKERRRKKEERKKERRKKEERCKGKKRIFSNVELVY